MLYFITEPESEGSYFKTYNQAVRSEFLRLGIRFIEVPLTGPNLDRQNLLKLAYINSKPADIWFMSYAHNPVIQFLVNKPGKKYGHVHGLEVSLFEPAVLQGYFLNEAKIFPLYNGLFVNSVWAKNMIIRSYPVLASRVAVSGFPFNASLLNKFHQVPKENKLIVFNQRFSLDKLNILEVYLAELFVKRGYRVAHLHAEENLKSILEDRESRVLFRESQKRGLNHIVNKTKEEYYANLARASILITTSIADTLSLGTLEAAALNVVPLAPRWGPFPEYLGSEHLYPPYNIEKILEKAACPPRINVNLEKYLPEKAVKIYLDVMGVY